MRTSKLLAIIAAIIMSISITSCFSGPLDHHETPDYGAMTAMITDYEDRYREFVMNGAGDVAYVTAEGSTPLGAPCSSRYRRSSDGVYESCSLIVQREMEESDEYFNMGNGIMMFVRMYYNDEGAPVIAKYISTGTEVFFVNDETQTCDPVTDITALDCFLTFDQVRRVYGIPLESEETQLAA